MGRHRPFSGLWRAPPRGAGAALLLASLICLPAAAADWCPGVKQAPAKAAQAVLRQADRRLDDAPRPLARVHTEGMLPGPAYTEAATARRDLSQMRAFALAWRLTQDRRYIAALSRYFDAWTRIYEISFNPVDETNFDVMIAAYALAAEALPAATRQSTAAFLRRMAGGYLERMERGRSEKKDIWINNWQSHRIQIVTLISVALEDRELLARSRQFFNEQLDNNIRADGSVLDFRLRDALHYVVYDLEPLARAALAARLAGEDWLRMKGRRDGGGKLDKALDWLVPYATGQHEHLEFVHSTVRFDAQRNAAGVKGFSGKWDRSSARELMWMAALLDARYRPVAQSISAAPPEAFAVCGPAAQRYQR